jgi:hypothetical protein
MASTQVSFETVKEIWDGYHGRLTKKPFDLVISGNMYFSWRGEPMSITFEQVTKIEALRRQIEELQGMLSAQSMYSRFGWLSPNDKWIPFSIDYTEIIRETVCKLTVAKIIKLLDESERLGVDVSISKQTLLEFLEEIKPKQEVTP